MTVFDRMGSMRLLCVGPEHPNGRQTEPWPDELLRGSKNVPDNRWIAAGSDGVAG